MPVSRRLRFEVLRRDGYTCRYCGAKVPDVVLTVDHVVPVALGGDDDPRNLVTACSGCNAGKSSIAPDSPIVEDVDATAMLFSKAMQRAADLTRAERGAVEDVCRGFYERWRDEFNTDSYLPRDWELSITKWLEVGLAAEDIYEAQRVTFLRTLTQQASWKYVCGVCWRMLADRQEAARRLIEDGEV